MSKQSVKAGNIKAVILAGSRDFGRCLLASRLPTALWPIGNQSALECLLCSLSNQGITEAVIFSNGDALLLDKSVAHIKFMKLKFLDEPLPVGTAGCIRDAAKGDKDSLLLVLPAAITSPPDIDALLETHRIEQCDMTVAFAPGVTDSGMARDVSEIYICEPTVLDYIPKEGYYDIKEGLIPAMVQAGRNINTAILSKPIGHFRDRLGYLDAIAGYLHNGINVNTGGCPWRESGADNVWLAGNQKIARSARIYGPVLVMDGASISEETIIFGPAVVGRDVTIAKNSFVENTVLWDGSAVGQNCQIRSCVVDYDAVIPDDGIIENQVVVCKHNSRLGSAVNKTASLIKDKVNQLRVVTQPTENPIGAALPSCAKSKKLMSNILKTLVIGAIAVAFLWSYWSGFKDLWGIWLRSDEYSSGLLVPFLALYVLWSRRHEVIKTPMRPSIWGLVVFVASQALRLFGLFFMYSSAERLSILLSIAAVVLLVFGWSVFRKTFTTLLFLGLMLPLPRSVHNAIMLPLQSWATSSAAFCLELLGYSVVREGNIISLNGITVAVAEACNGLRMVMAFVVITGLVVLLVQRAWWEKLIVLLSSLPIALLCNTIRLTITAVAFTVLSGEKWEGVFHDYGGYAMMPLALAVVIFELWLLMKLTTVPEETLQAVIIRKSVN
ncbi:MAG: exosortase [Planctomycetota bacterium]|nr:MAG: exosortase [Planctomycetota bacterium]